MAATAATVKVKGLTELNRALKKMESDLSRELRDTLVKIGEPVRVEAERLAVSRIHSAGDRWTRMRLGVTTKMAYIAPRARNRGGSKRPNFGALLMEDAMIPALERIEPLAVHEMEAMIDRASLEAGFR